MYASHNSQDEESDTELKSRGERKKEKEREHERRIEREREKERESHRQKGKEGEREKRYYLARYEILSRQRHCWYRSRRRKSELNNKPVNNR